MDLAIDLVCQNVLVNAQGTARRKFLKSYKPGRSSYSDLDKYTDDIWVFHGTYKENPGWIEDKDGIYIRTLVHVI